MPQRLNIFEWDICPPNHLPTMEKERKKKKIMKDQKLGLLIHFSWDKFKHHCMKSIPDKCFQELL